MAGGYTGQLVALDVDTPTELDTNQSKADEARYQAQLLKSQSQLAQATLPAETELRQNQARSLGIQNDQQQLALNDTISFTKARQRYLMDLRKGNGDQGQAGNAAPAPTSQLAQAPGLFSSGVSQAMRQIDPDDPDAAQKWDEQMNFAADLGDDQAKQFVGKFSPSNLKSWQSAMGAHSVGEQQSPLAAAGGASGAPGATQQSPLAAAAADASGQGASTEQLGIDPATGNPDQDMMEMAAIHPDEAAKLQSLQGQLQFQKTGDVEYLRRYSPQLYKTLADGTKAMTDAQKEAAAAHADIMGRTANGLLSRARELQAAGKDPNKDAELQGAYRQAVVNLAKQGYLPPEVAQKELANPNIDFPQLEQFSVSSMTTSEWMKASGQEAGAQAQAEAQAKQANPAVEYRTVKNIDGSESIVRVGGSGGAASGSGGADASGATSGQRFTGGWTPRIRNGGDNPDTAVDNKIAASAKTLGLSPDADLSKMSPMAIAQAMTANEGGKGSIADTHNNPANLRNPDGSYKSYPTKAAGLQAAADLVSRKLGAGQTTVRSMIEGLPVGGQGGAQGAPTGGANVVYQSQGVSGDGLESQAQAIANGMAPPITGSKASTGIGATIMGRVFAINPRYDAKLYNPQQATIKSFYAGPDSKTVQALNNATQHLAQLGGMVDALNNGNIQTFNRIGNSLSAEFGGTAPTDFQAVKQMVGGELAKVISGGVSGEGDRAEAAKWLSEANSPAQLKSAIERVKGLLGSQFHTLQNKYETGTGRKDFLNLVVPDVKTAWAGGHGGGGQSVANPFNGSPAPVHIATQADVMALKPGTQFVGPDGKVRVRP